MLIGSSIAISQKALVIFGGGAVCFSFGTFWTPGVYTIAPTAQLDNQQFWRYAETLTTAHGQKPLISSIAVKSVLSNRKSETVTSPRCKIDSAVEFERLVVAGQPMVLESTDLGSCKDLWTNEYLKLKIGADREVR